MVQVPREQLRALVARIEKLEEEKAAIAEDIREVYAEAKAMGFDTKVLRKVIAMRKRDRHELEEEQALMDLYLHALGMTPLERWAARQDGGDGEVMAQIDIPVQPVEKRDGTLQPVSDGRDIETTITVSTDGGPAVSMTMDEFRQSISEKFGGAR